MIVDANLLLYAYDTASPRHGAAQKWFETILVGEERVGLPLQTLLAFIRIATSPAAFSRPMATAAAFGAVRTWLARPVVAMTAPGERHWEILRDVAAAGQVRGPGLMDAHLAALAIEHGATLFTTDRGYARFPRLRFKNPIPN